MIPSGVYSPPLGIMNVTNGPLDAHWLTAVALNAPPQLLSCAVVIGFVRYEIRPGYVFVVDEALVCTACSNAATPDATCASLSAVVSARCRSMKLTSDGAVTAARIAMITAAIATSASVKPSRLRNRVGMRVASRCDMRHHTTSAPLPSQDDK